MRALPRGRLLIACVRPYHGLGNRMRVVLGGQSLAEVTDRQFAYCWPTGRGFGARLDDLWRTELREVAAPVSRALALRYPYRDERASWRAAAEGQRVWQLRTSQPIELPPTAKPWTQRLRELAPTEPVAQRIAEFFAAHLAGRHYVGVMIRAHAVSHAQSREYSPVEWFVERMRDIRRAAPDTAFFLSCDVPEVQERVAADLGDTYFQSDKGAYNSRTALIAAVVDLYLLAASSHVLAPHYSSFPELAIHLAAEGIALETSRTAADQAWENRPRRLVADPLRPGG